MSESNNKYMGQSITVLKGLEPVRKRPGMYIGSTGPNGLHHLVYEVVDNCIDEAMAGFCTEITVALEKDDICRVRDNGRGIPVDIHPTEGISALELVLTRLHAGGKFDKNSYKVSGGLHGVGVSCVNALSDWLEAYVERDGKKYYERFQRGIPDEPVKEIGTSELNGTTIRWKSDATIFTETTTYDFNVLSERLRELAFLNPGIKIIFRDERLETPKEVVFKFEGGIKEFVTYLNKNQNTVPEEPLYISGKTDDIEVEISLQYNKTDKETIFTYVNDINTREGGTHLEGFKTALSFVCNKFLEKYPKVQKKLELTKAEKEAAKKAGKEITYEKFASDDTRVGITAIISTKVPEPQFEGQTKTKLGNTQVRSIVDALVKEKLTLYFEQNPQTTEIILDKIASEAAARIAAEKTRNATRKKNLNDSFGLPSKLSDCSLKNPELCELYIVEGDSAGGSAKKGRDSKTQAILPLWGKMLNVEKVGSDKVLHNDKLEPVIASLGVGGLGKNCNIDKIRYHKIIIMADADVDGSHIRTLLLTFFFRYMPQVIERGYVYLAMPPLYGIKRTKNDKNPIYTYTDEEQEEKLKSLGDTRDKAIIQRYKGLGEMDGKQLWETTMDPSKRKMRVVTIPDAQEADRIFTICMGEDVEPRRQFIEENSSYANLDI